METTGNASDVETVILIVRQHLVGSCRQSGCIQSGQLLQALYMWQLRILRPLGTLLGRPIQDTHNALWVVMTMWQQSRMLIAVILDIIIDFRRFCARRAV